MESTTRLTRPSRSGSLRSIEALPRALALSNCTIVLSTPKPPVNWLLSPPRLKTSPDETHTEPGPEMFPLNAPLPLAHKDR